jgi:hypothetical protein
MDSDSDEKKYYASEDMKDEGEPRPQFLDNSDDRPSPQHEVTEAESLHFLLRHYRWDIQFKQTGRLLDENGTALLTILQTNDGTC